MSGSRRRTGATVTRVRRRRSVRSRCTIRRTLDQVVVYAKRDYGSGEELCERLGDMSVAESLQHFGYVPVVAEESPRNCVLMVLEAKKKKFEKNLRDAGFQVPWRVCVPFAAREQSLDLLAAYIELSHGRHVDVDEHSIPQKRAAAAERVYSRIDSIGIPRR